MKKPKIAVTSLDESITELVKQTEKKILVIWALDCAECVLPYFEDKYSDNRPRLAITAGRAWVRTGIFHMADIRRDALGAHAAARQVETDDVARSAARAAGQALVTTHVAAHALAAARYAATVIRDATDSDEAVSAERNWQMQHLLELMKT